jgi:hypothetical protein
MRARGALLRQLSTKRATGLIEGQQFNTEDLASPRWHVRISRDDDTAKLLLDRILADKPTS